jgi:hypothetical protein
VTEKTVAELELEIDSVLRLAAGPEPTTGTEAAMPAFQYRLILKDGTSADSPQFVTATPTWHEGDTFMSRPGRTFRILAINESSDDFHAEWTVEVE